MAIQLALLVAVHGRSGVALTETSAFPPLAHYSAACDYYAHVIPIKVDALAITSWTVTPNVNWISVEDAGNGQGVGTVSVVIAENPSYRERTGTVTIGTETFTVTQEGRTPP